MSKLVIYGDSRSGNCLKVKWTADLLGAPHEWRETDIMAGESRTEAFLKLNPAGQVPVVILPDGRPLSQSNAVISYLAAVHGSSLLPTDLYERAKVDEWLFWEQYSHEPYIAVRRFQKYYLGKGDDEINPQLLVKGMRAFDRMELALQGRKYLVGEALTVADIALVAYTRMAGDGGFDLSAFPAVRGWVARVEADLSLPPHESAI